MEKRNQAVPKGPAVQWYFKDWLDYKVLRMSDAAQGVYMRLLAHIWTGTEDQYRIKSDSKRLKRVLGLTSKKWDRYYKEIQDVDENGHQKDPIFLEQGGYLISGRLRKEKAKQVLRSKQASNAAKSRWMQAHCSEHAEETPTNDAVSNARAMRSHMRKPCPSSSSSSSSSLIPFEKTTTVRDSLEPSNEPASAIGLSEQQQFLGGGEEENPERDPEKKIPADLATLLTPTQKKQAHGYSPDAIKKAWAYTQRQRQEGKIHTTIIRTFFWALGADVQPEPERLPEKSKYFCPRCSNLPMSETVDCPICNGRQAVYATEEEWEDTIRRETALLRAAQASEAPLPAIASHPNSTADGGEIARKLSDAVSDDIL